MHKAIALPFDFDSSPKHNFVQFSFNPKTNQPTKTSFVLPLVIVQKPVKKREKLMNAYITNQAVKVTVSAEHDQHITTLDKHDGRED